jgi:hypothetical protein
MNNKLFFTCPFDSLELSLKQKFGSRIHIITCSGCTIPYDDNLFIELTQACIKDNCITDINFVIDAQSRLINDVISQNPLFGLMAEYSIQEIYSNNYNTHFRGESFMRQKINLADLIVQKQIDKFLFSDSFSDLIIDNHIKVNGVIYSKIGLNIDPATSLKYKMPLYEL